VVKRLLKPQLLLLPLRLLKLLPLPLLLLLKLLLLKPQRSKLTSLTKKPAQAGFFIARKFPPQAISRHSSPSSCVATAIQSSTHPNALKTG
jgi:hypothetical protein